MVKVRELVHGNLTLNLWWETSYSSGVCAAPQTELRRGEASRAEPGGSVGLANLPIARLWLMCACLFASAPVHPGLIQVLLLTKPDVFFNFILFKKKKNQLHFPA